MATFEDAPGFYTRRQVSELTTLSRSSLSRYVEEKIFPPPVKFTRRKSLWYRPHVHSWIRAKLLGLAWVPEMPPEVPS
ncbi:helix-turn-helix transcriptional regulator [Ensifer adhaerens]|uniref:helix-turn-helix transcriptional regulator n=1 Tax=Ensifer adhaerens TaxID=106592 RepID=UPI0008072E52|nr:AlpA family phage regulatory protein [Ensifer adhaerens]